jgi:hypothetical protein
MNIETSHALLVRGRNLEECRNRVKSFFAKNFLVKYDTVEIVEDRSCSAETPLFHELLNSGLDCNHQALVNILDELKESGFTKLSDLAEMRQGYESKIFHTAAHLLDGFFGIDTCFYNLEEDSHFLGKRTEAEIQEHPAEFFIITVNCFSGDKDKSDQLARLRKFNVD